jgi:hypothetical protein
MECPDPFTVMTSSRKASRPSFHHGINERTVMTTMCRIITPTMMIMFAINIYPTTPVVIYHCGLHPNEKPVAEPIGIVYTFPLVIWCMKLPWNIPAAEPPT